MVAEDFDRDSEDLIREVRLETDLRQAFVAGVETGVNLAQADDIGREEFHDAVKSDFRRFLDEEALPR